jgi:hypothetical protein
VSKDPLADPATARAVAIVTALALLCGPLISAVNGGPRSLPGIALASPVLFHMERGVIAAALVTASAIFVVRAWAGYYPAKLSTTGAEYPTAAIGGTALGDAGTLLVDLRSSHETLAEDVAALAAAVAARQADLEQRVTRLAGEHGA